MQVASDALNIVEHANMVIHERRRLRLCNLKLRDLLTRLVTLVDLLLELVEAIVERLVLLGDSLDFLLES